MIKKLIYSITFIFLFSPITLAQTQNGEVDYNAIEYLFFYGDDYKFESLGDKYLYLYDKSYDEKNKKFYLKEAMRFYFLLSRYNPESIEANIGLGRVYDAMKLDTKAKSHFFLAYNFDNYNPKTNLYIGNFYYTRQDYINALEYYNAAFHNGYSKNVFLNYRLATIYEKIADIEMAKRHYKWLQKLNPKDIDLPNKIHSIDELNYSDTLYYQYKK